VAAAPRQPLRLYLKDGVQPAQAIEALTSRILAAKNLAGAVSPGGIGPGSGCGLPGEAPGRLPPLGGSD